MTVPPEEPQQEEVQRLVGVGYNFDWSSTLLLSVRDAQAARQFVRALSDKDLVTYVLDSTWDAEFTERGACAVSIGFSFRGLEALGLEGRRLELFRQKAPAFAEGAFLRAPRRLADSGASRPELWRAQFWPDAAHVVLILHADSEGALQAMLATLQKLAAGAFVPESWQQVIWGKHMERPEDAPGQRRVHFGFLDGITKTGIRGFPGHEKATKDELHAPGEFLRGYLNDEKFNLWLLANENPDDALFFRNGSFGAFRQMQQDEAAFIAFVSRSSAMLGVDQAYVKAKLCGRWDNGIVVKPGQTGAPPDYPKGQGLNDFNFLDDQEGLGCPFGAHIRRMNPRKDPVVPFRLRPLIRRGMPYGPKFAAPVENEERGLLGLFFCASLEDQFEHLLAEWGNANPMGPDNRGNAKDPLFGNHEDRGAVFDIPVSDEEPCQLDGFRPFVTTRGTVYAFFPSRTTVNAIARLQPDAWNRTR